MAFEGYFINTGRFIPTGQRTTPSIPMPVGRRFSPGGPTTQPAAAPQAGTPTTNASVPSSGEGQTQVHYWSSVQGPGIPFQGGAGSGIDVSALGLHPGEQVHNQPGIGTLRAMNAGEAYPPKPGMGWGVQNRRVFGHHILDPLTSNNPKLPGYGGGSAGLRHGGGPSHPFFSSRSRFSDGTPTGGIPNGPDRRTEKR